MKIIYNDLISREQAIKALEKGFIFHSYAGGMAKRIVENLPSAEKTGKWEYIGGYGYQYRCSACIMCAEYKTKYCPHCGSRMEKK